MKKPYVWAAIIGGLIILGNILSVATTFSNPTHLPYKVILAMTATSAAWILFGTFLIWLFFQGKKKEDRGHTTEKPELNSAEDKARLARIQNWVVAFFVIFVIISSLGNWVRNDYSAGFTLVNIETTFDVLINLVLLWLVIQLIRQKKVLDYILVVVLAMVVIEGTLSYLREGWAGGLSRCPRFFHI
jgi:H+/Cl- antiporter ClcA